MSANPLRRRDNPWAERLWFGLLVLLGGVAVWADNALLAVLVIGGIVIDRIDDLEGRLRNELDRRERGDLS